jgi:hypothetical protein
VMVQAVKKAPDKTCTVLHRTIVNICLKLNLLAPTLPEMCTAAETLISGPLTADQGWQQ